MCPDRVSASGGMAVLYDSVAILREAGYDAAVVHMSPGVIYENTPHKLPTFYTPKIIKNIEARMGPLQRFRAKIESSRKSSKAVKNAPLELRETDVLVVPEVLLRDATEAFPEAKKIVFVQNSFSYLNGCAQLIRNKINPQRNVIWSVGIADIVLKALKLAGADPISYCPVAPNLTLFPFSAEKRNKISYMPRKRPEEAIMIDHALRQRGKIGDYEIVEIEGMTQAEVAQHLGESRFFISLMHKEALGFPAMESMSAGCVVIGYTGLGTEEYFDADTGLPIAEGDTVGIVEAVEAAVAEYERSPERFDKMRKLASERIQTRYAQDRFKSSLLESWAEMVKATGRA